MRIFHVSETPNIACFEPRIADDGRAVVWAIDDLHLPNYLLPRECPRVCVRRGACDDAALVARVLGASEHAIYVEAAWRKQIAEATLFVYEFDASQFVCVDANAGYFQSMIELQPLAMTTLEDATHELSSRGVALHFVDNLWPIQQVIISSELQFSCIRMRNAAAVESRGHP
jgi:hypothetical protein